VRQVGLVLAGLVVDRLVPAGAEVLVAVDDTLFRRSGRRMADAFWQHDGSRPGPKRAQVGYGNNWLIAGIVVDLPFLDRPVCLPVAFALVGKDGPSKQALAGQLITAIATALPGRRINVVADAWYAGADGAETRTALRGRGLPAGVSLTSRLRANAVLTAIATPVPGKPGRPKRIGQRLGTPKHLAALMTAQARWTSATVGQRVLEVAVGARSSCIGVDPRSPTRLPEDGTSVEPVEPIRVDLGRELDANLAIEKQLCEPLAIEETPAGHCRDIAGLRSEVVHTPPGRSEIRRSHRSVADS
jgi:hypothetical protein